MTDVPSPGRRLVLVGNPDSVHIGSHLAEAAAAAGYHMRFEDVRAGSAHCQRTVADRRSLPEHPLVGMRVLLPKNR